MKKTSINHPKSQAFSAILFVLFILVAACVTVQSQSIPTVAIRKLEVERKPIFNHVLLLPVTGTTDREGELSNLIQKESLHILGKGVGTAEDLLPIFNALDSPQLLPISMQPQLLWFEKLLKNNQPDQIIRSGIERFPGMEFSYGLMKDPSTTLRSLTNQARQLENISDLVQKNDRPVLGEILKSQHELHADLIKLFYWAQAQYQPQYLLVFYLNGDAELWSQGKPIVLKTVAINFESGGIRFAGSITHVEESPVATKPELRKALFEDLLRTLTNRLLHDCMLGSAN